MTQREQTAVAIRLTGVSKHFGEVVAVDKLDLDVLHGEFLTLLGPSGSGKTTVLRMIAGFETPTAGRIELDGLDVTDLAPYDRDVNTVFQDYALFPHMTVLQNVAYGLRIKKVAKSVAHERAEAALASVELAGYGHRKPSQLSGGQRQRVALARALVNEPKVLLLDEPLGALDLKLRQQMQLELKDLQRRLGITFVFVTHDQEEALTMSDRIAVFSGGRIHQLDTPAAIYERPATRFVAGFVGSTNIIEGDLAERITGRSGSFSLRPERISLKPERATGDRRRVDGTVHGVEYLGAATRFVIDLTDGQTLSVWEQNAGLSDAERELAVGDAVTLSWSPSAEIEIS